ncbi:FRAS1-related extracellular matrix protein 3-like [Gigantopelta aegis]|uniref:FRAS1-related extracellular matrix protein 3-like n=1 Tax=Gigantopelta aegis TaxID=1735272 RepID=UPI001B88B5D3|nr:FRAS1-related extracellular matrix protein 3-like [Gigantopelta aegis]
MKVSAVSVNEDAGSVIITVKRDPVDGIMPAVTVLVQTTDKEAVAGSDFVVDGTPLTAVFAQGETEATVNISITDDDREEIAETFDVEIKTDAAYTIGSTPNTTVTINSDDLSTVSIKNEPNAVLESDAGARFVFLRELPAGGSDTALDLTLTITDGTAVAGDDYMQADPGVSFTFPIPSVGDTYSQMEFEIPMMFDDLYEPEETFTVAVPNQPTKYKLGWSNSAIVTITDDDEPMFKFSPATLTLNEGAGGTGSIVMVNHADNSPDYTVDILTKDGTALSASDYTSITSSITFTSASDTMTFPISTGADQVCMIYTDFVHAR